MKHRIFIAIPVPADLQEEVFNWRRSIPKLEDCPVRWISGKNLHLTLIPPWYEVEIEKVKNKIEKIDFPKPFKIKFQKVEYGPRRPFRLIWAKGLVVPELDKIKVVLQAIFSNGREFVYEDGPRFIPHLTLARFREEDFKNFLVKDLKEKVDWKLEVNSIVLMESKLLRSGADYEILDRVKLS